MRPLVAMAGLAALAAHGAAHAQRTTDNAVTASDDAFGRAVGNERIGIYSQDDVRGFNPVDAGNVRIEGLYFDQASILPSRLVEGSSIRVGYAARGTPFPAPTGIVDNRLQKFNGTASASAHFEVEDDNNVGGSMEFKLPVAGDWLGVSGGAGFREASQPHGRTGSFRNYGLTLTARPGQASEITAFFGAFRGKRLDAHPFLFPAGDFLPPEQPRHVDQSQPWSQTSSKGSLGGVVTRFPIGAFKLEAGLFRSTRKDLASFALLQLGVMPDGRVANLVAIADQGNGITATSGEVRIGRTFQIGKFRHGLIISYRGREQARDFGGQQRISLGPSQAGVRLVLPRPVIAVGPDDHSVATQQALGIQYDLRGPAASQLSLALHKNRYRKRTDFANPLLAEALTSADPWLYSLSASVEPVRGFTLYGGHVRGLEESAAAPDNALNRSEAPPAMLTRQSDFGLRTAITPKLSLITGVFQIRKPSFGIDQALRFGNQGIVTNRGVEVSLAGVLVPGLTVVAGSLFVSPKISSAAVTAGQAGERPIASFKRRSIFNLDWKPQGQDALSFDLAFESLSSVAANRLNTLFAPARENLSLGARYRFAVGKARFLVRPQIQNLFNDYGHRVNSGGGFSFTLPRTLALTLSADI